MATNRIYTLNGLVATLDGSILDDGSGNEVYIQALGGTITTVGDFKFHTFLTSGTFDVISLGTQTDVSALVVGGGSGTSGVGLYAPSARGGGGGGEVVEDYSLTVEEVAYNITVGLGGTGGIYSGNVGYFGGSGQPSSINTLTPTTLLSAAGGQGGSGIDFGRNGYTSGSGYGGGGGYATNENAGGGGGNSEGGESGTIAGAGDGGDGTLSGITGSYYGGGGSGGGTADKSYGGLGGGGNGQHNATPAQNGAANTGGGGGGRRSQNINGTTGGSGVVVIKYRYK